MSSKQYPLEKVLICTSAETILFGWTSSKDAKLKGIPSTADMVKLLIDDPDSAPAQKRKDELIARAKKDGVDLFDTALQQEVNDAIVWAQKLPLEQKSPTGFLAAFDKEPYNNVIRDIAHSGYVTVGKFGFACSILRSYRLNEDRKNQNYVGGVGSTIGGIAAVLSVKSIAWFKTQQRTSWLVTMKENENVIKWWANSDPNFQAGDIVNYTGKVKSHDDFNGSKSTTINYAKVEKR